MSTIYLISGVVILTLFYYHYKSRRLHKKQINPEIQNQIVTDPGKEIKPEIAQKINGYIQQINLKKCKKE